MTFEDLQKANETLSTMDIKGKNYVLVNERVKAFRMLYPEGTITTEILSLENGVVTMQAKVMDAEGKLLSTGLAYEKETSSYINKTSYIENCETSAVGRALGFLGIGVDTSIASYEEVQNAVNNQGEQKPKKKSAYQERLEAEHPEDRVTEKEAIDLANELVKAGGNIEWFLKKYKVNAFVELTPAQMVEIYGAIDDNVRKQKQANS